ncbi:asparagine synthase (glutamine-hydrolysing) [Verrucomicrobium sp. GAS474]|nr:asparagine synthase (glutamine-hydrolysing) [Verrucomicrobium sp. GAS474]
MCGFLVDFRSMGKAEALDCAEIAHRGPDARGVWTSPDGTVWMGHVRLSILDLSPAGAQPMVGGSDGFWGKGALVFNGEIYNHQALRAELAAGYPDAGITWRGTSDTETLLVGLSLEGEAFVPRLRGMFAFVWHVPEERYLLAARDALGIKPLYYSRRPEGLAFASEVRPLKDRYGTPPSRGEFSAYLQWGACPETMILFPSVTALPPAHVLKAGPGAGVEIRRYWKPGRLPRVAEESENPVRRVRALLEKAVREHLLSDVPVASFLSSGLDSSLITALAARNSPKGLETFTVGFDAAAGSDETAMAAEFSAHCGARHHVVRLTKAETLQCVEEAVEKMDLPSVDAINMYIVCRAVRGFDLKVALSGLGADEIFGGYPSFRDAPLLSLLARVPRPLRHLAGLFSEPGRRLADLPDASMRTVSLFRRRFWTDHMLRLSGLPTRDFLPKEEAETQVPLRDAFAQVSWAESSGYMRNMLLRDADQMSMAVSIELRVPFLDLDLFDYVLSLPAHEKTRYDRTKGLLVEACRDLLPERFLTARKQGFSLPMREWMEGSLRPYVRRGLDEVVASDVGALPERFIHRLEADFAAGRLHWTRLWSLVVLGHYLKRNRVPSARDPFLARGHA